jgi:hypothetical protein
VSESSTQLSPEDIAALLEQNAVMRRLLAEHQWSGLTPAESGGVCPECCGSARSGHRPGCALEAVLDAPELS